MADVARVLIVNADDLGFTDGVTRGIVDAHRAGSVTSASLMVNTPGFAYALTCIRSLPALGVGLHLNLTAGAPLVAAELVPSLTDPVTRRLVPLHRLAGRAWLGRVSEEELRREIVAQFARATDAGVKLTHVDGHQHVHQLPHVMPLVRDVARQFGVRRIRESLEPLSHRVTRAQATIVKALLHMARGTKAAQHPSPFHFRGISLQGGGPFARRLAEDLRALPPGTTELMVHPGYPDATLALLDDYLEPRAAELAALTSAPIRALLGALPIRLATFATA